MLQLLLHFKKFQSIINTPQFFSQGSVDFIQVYKSIYRLNFMWCACIGYTESWTLSNGGYYKIILLVFWIIHVCTYYPMGISTPQMWSPFLHWLWWVAYATTQLHSQNYLHVCIPVCTFTIAYSCECHYLFTHSYSILCTHVCYYLQMHRIMSVNVHEC